MVKKVTYQHRRRNDRRIEIRKNGYENANEDACTKRSTWLQRDQFKKWTVNRSPHGNKTAREQFGLKTYKLHVRQKREERQRKDREKGTKKVQPIGMSTSFPSNQISCVEKAHNVYKEKTKTSKGSM